MTACSGFGVDAVVPMFSGSPELRRWSASPSVRTRQSVLESRQRTATAFPPRAPHTSRHRAAFRTPSTIASPQSRVPLAQKQSNARTHSNPPESSHHPRSHINIGAPSSAQSSDHPSRLPRPPFPLPQNQKTRTLSLHPPTSSNPNNHRPALPQMSPPTHTPLPNRLGKSGNIPIRRKREGYLVGRRALRSRHGCFVRICKSPAPTLRSEEEPWRWCTLCLFLLVCQILGQEGVRGVGGEKGRKGGWSGAMGVCSITNVV